MRSDGTGRTQLTFPPEIAIEPHWSPDGRQIAYTGPANGGHWRIRVISADGGTAKEMTAAPVEQGVPTWSPDGSKIVFGEVRSERPRQLMQIHMLEVRTGREEPVKGSSGLWNARWSADGRWIAALTSDSKTLLICDTQTLRWEALASFDDVESPAWTSNSKTLYFKTTVRVSGGHKATLNRIDIGSHRIDTVADLDNVPETDTAWYGLSADDSPIMLTVVKTRELFSIVVPR